LPGSAALSPVRIGASLAEQAQREQQRKEAQAQQHNRDYRGDGLELLQRTQALTLSLRIGIG
jgi:hypothetical protein